ncbi:hypothetical protein BJ546DRAFT_449865 [Cryomyces antarcticus]|uniref:Uncharacterized protein n=1 Tax=Cryomyces antarcticus TaxID=329879 RepID=A0ABR0LQW3_9PEZI|nr:hypothetical protein LTR39_000608 [Cryomyces antarcticus]KAK5020662.1 hypothetical protein LTR60_000320 [Cryomyces antarcticus]KAK5202006.1 hypothetical protein LTR16_000715 [Cryomyces antarcticus]
MHTNSVVVATLSLFSALVNSNPLTNPSLETSPATALVERTAGAVYVCTDINWGGQCSYIATPLNKCVVLEGALLDSISSFGPDQGGFCIITDNPRCGVSSPYFDISYPGIADLRTIGWNDRVQSYICLTS